MWAMPREDRWMHKHQQTGARPVAPTIMVVLVATAALVACGGSPTPSQSQGQRFPVTINEAGGAAVTISHQPHRIVSLSPTATEMLFAIGAGRQVIAVDDQSNYPASAPTTKLSGFQPNIEAIAGYAPDLVVAAEDTGSLVHGMQALSIPILLEPAATTLDDSYAQIKQLGTATGHASSADALVAQMRSQVAQFVSSLARPSHRLRVYHELDNTYYSVTSATVIGQVYKIFGLTHIADAATAAAPDYPQLSAEFIVSSDPDLIVLADTRCCDQNLDT
ncbi:MAG TPA: helical backbone metal receptor, partial [Candidatus Dormibacteraeota bacterium]|nr:helical backbone metal receptor [Candidatus Dormibacteraeota bacterium]